MCLSFYDWYCDLPPASPQVWGEQTDVPESADWYNSSYIIVLGLERPADADAGRALLHRGPLQRHQDRGDHAGLRRGGQARATSGCIPKQGTDAALAFALGHVMLREFHLEQPSPYFSDYAGSTPTCRCW